MRETKDSIIASLDRFRVFGVFTLLQFLLLMGTISALLTVLYKFFF
jgi:hypothetical protein